MEKNNTFTQGRILKPLILFALPVLLALFLQAMYGAVDLLIVGKFASSADVSAVSTGSQIMMTLTNLVSSFAMGTTVLLGQQIGCGERKQGGRTVGTAIVMFTVIALVMTAVLVIFAPQVSSIMNAPEEAFDKTVAYMRICGGGMLVIVAYNLIGCIFSVIVSFGVIRKKELPFEMHKTDIGVHGRTLRKMVGLGAPIALQDLLVSISFLIILAIVNSMGVTASAGVGVAEKVCAFIMLISSAFMQSISAFVAQNYGAGRMDRAKKALHYGVAVSFAIGVGMFFLSFFHGNVLAGIFSSDAMVIEAAADYLKAYAIDCLFTAIFFCYIGFYNGIGMTKFVMIKGIIGAFCVRVPVSWFMSRRAGATLFDIGLATPFSSILQLVLCLGCMLYLRKKKWV